MKQAATNEDYLYGLMKLETLIHSLKFDLNPELYVSEPNDY